MQKGSKYGEVPHGIVFTLRELVIVCVLISVVCKSNRCNLQTLGKDAFIVDALRVFPPLSFLLWTMQPYMFKTVQSNNQIYKPSKQSRRLI